jgi:hypothetical protein
MTRFRRNSVAAAVGRGHDVVVRQKKREKRDIRVIPLLVPYSQFRAATKSRPERVKI